MKKIIILIFFMFILTGCYNYNEMNELAIVSTLGIEKERDNFIISASIVNIKKGSNQGSENSNSSKTVVFKTRGKNISECITNLSKVSSKKIFLSHLNLIILSEDVIKNDIFYITDFFLRETKNKINFYIATTTKNKPSEILETLSSLEDLPGIDTIKIIENSSSFKGTSSIITFEKLIDTYLKKGVVPVYTDVIIDGDYKKNNDLKDLTKAKPNAILKINNLVFFSGINSYKLNNDESLGYNILNNNIINPVLTRKCDNEKNTYSIKIIGSKTKFIDNLKNNEIIINLDVKSSINEYNCKNDARNADTRKKITKEINYTLSNKYFDFEEKNWNKEGLPKLKFKIKTNIEIVKTGNLMRSIVKEKKYGK